MDRMYRLAMGVTITPDMSIDDFNSVVKGISFSSVILGFAFWAARIIGVCGIAWGVYYFVMAWQNSDGTEIIPGVYRVLLGGVLVSLPYLFQQVGIVKIA